MTKIILVRHGETEWNKIRRIQGSASDTPLSEIGRKQAESLAVKLKDEKVLAIYSSPLQRALHTAQAIAQHHQMTINQLPALKEINVGELEGKMGAELKSRFDEIICRNCNNGNFIRLPGGESIGNVQDRAWSAITGIASQHPEGTVIVVTHYFVIMSLVCKILNLPLSQIIRLRLNTGSITAFTMVGHNGHLDARLELFNDSCHTLFS